MRLPHFGNAEEYIPYRSENPISSIWDELDLISDPTFLKRSASNTDSDYIKFICMSIRQAKEYFVASNDVTYTTKPLLLYYSCLNMAKAALAIRNDVIPSGFHGIKTPSYSDNIVDAKIVVSGGVFDEINRVTKSSISVGDEICIKSFFERAIELIDIYHRYYGETPSLVDVGVKRYDDNIVINIHKQHSDAIPNLKEVLIDKLSGDFELEDDDTSEDIIFKNAFEMPKDKGGITVGDEILNKYAQYSIMNDDKTYIDISDRYISQESCYYALIFILGSIVRYQPVKLYDWLHDVQKSNRAILERVCNVVSRVFPNLMLNIIYRGRYKFAPSFI